MSMTIHSEAFRDGDPIPKQYTGEGEDISPPLVWAHAPAGTREFVLMVDDPDAPSRDPWVHWLIYKIPADATGLPRGVAASAQLKQPAGAVQGHNSWTSGRVIGYRGPMPPPGSGPHHYRFRLFALDAPLAVADSATVATLRSLIDGHVLAEAVLVGTYER
ncbi:MAG TPA: YbhB/YbcL family Raf kinase inhibitor-like protein [Pirellulales bacterium]|nr:YbhB/YbcL family Raf kinase inhibitor-like protein [Pirellulales bacterium]